MKTGMNRNLKFSNAIWKQICPEMCYVLLACFLWEVNLKYGIVQSLIVTMEKSEQNALKKICANMWEC